jgi:hypothetical protein
MQTRFRSGSAVAVRRRRVPRLLAAARGAAPLLALALGACDDAADPVRPGAAAGAPAAGVAAAAEPPLVKGFARLLAPVDGVVSGPSTYNAYPARVKSAYPGAGDRDRDHELVLTFQGLRRVLDGEPHVQVTPVRNYSDEDGRDVCRAWGRAAANGADVEVVARCERAGDHVRSLVAAQVFDRDAPAAYATVGEDGAAENARLLARTEQVAEGRYRVFFRRDPLFGAGAKPIAFVTPRSVDLRRHTSLNVRCELASVGSKFERAGELGVEVDCFGIGGARVDAAFNVVALAQRPRTAYALVGDGRQLFEANTHNPAGEVEVYSRGVGKYRVAFFGLAESWTDGGTVMVAAHGAGGGTCAADHWEQVAGAVRVDVQCRGALGAPAEQRFAVLATTRH